jgi:hypothetical protein
LIEKIWDEDSNDPVNDVVHGFKTVPCWLVPLGQAMVILVVVGLIMWTGRVE